MSEEDLVYQKYDLYALDVMYLQKALHICIKEEKRLAETFYESLFEEHPITERFFKNDRNKQQLMFSTLIEAAAAEMMNPRSLEPLLKSVGQHHKNHKLSKEHLEMGRSPFFKAVTKCIGKKEFTEHFTRWNNLYSMLIDVMIDDVAGEPNE